MFFDGAPHDMAGSVGDDAIDGAVVAGDEQRELRATGAADEGDAVRFDVGLPLEPGDGGIEVFERDVAQGGRQGFEVEVGERENNEPVVGKATTEVFGGADAAIGATEHDDTAVALRVVGAKVSAHNADFADGALNDGRFAGGGGVGGFDGAGASDGDDKAGSRSGAESEPERGELHSKKGVVQTLVIREGRARARVIAARRRRGQSLREQSISGAAGAKSSLAREARRPNSRAFA